MYWDSDSGCCIDPFDNLGLSDLRTGMWEELHTYLISRRKSIEEDIGRYLDFVAAIREFIQKGTKNNEQ